MNLALSRRIMSGLPLSVGTSHAFESLFAPVQQPYDPERKVPAIIPVTDYEQCFINVTTLIRNMASAAENDTFKEAKFEDIFTVLLEEIDVINNLFHSASGGSCKAIFYHCTYRSLMAQANRATQQLFKLREPKTPNQIHYADQVEKTVAHLHKVTEEIRTFDDGIDETEYKRSLVLTHQPYDLIHFRKFSTLDLLESNTGVLKPRLKWYTKFAPMGQEDLSHLPFCKKILCCFGDKSLIHPGPPVLRKTLLDIAAKGHWTPLTTDDKMRLDVSVYSTDPFLHAAWKAL